MSFKKFLFILLLIFVVGAFMAVSFGVVQAAKSAGPSNHPPVCYPINYPVGGYWSMACIDQENNISSVFLESTSPSNLTWDNAYVEMVVELDSTTTIAWEVCDSNGACVRGRYP